MTKEKNPKQRIKHIIFFLSLFYITIYIPLSITIYSQNWYEFNYNQQEPYSTMNKQTKINFTQNLINYFYHKEQLNDKWSFKEKLHFKEVRQIFDILFFIFVANIISLLLFFKKTLLKNQL